MSTSAPLARRAGRVVLVSQEGSVLLLSGTDPRLPDAPRFWFVPGGGAADGETLEEAARRELYEEVGARVGELGPPAWRREVSFVFDGAHYHQAESFFVVRAPYFRPEPTALTDLERRAGMAARWWPLAELATTREVVHPAALASLLAAWLAEGPPPEPLVID